MSLWSDFETNQGRQIFKWTHYFPIYEQHFSRYVNRPMTFIEIGCGQGGSLQMWKRYFGPLARIVGLDIRPDCAAFQDEQVAVRIGDQSDPAFLDAVLAEFGRPTIVLDDGSHVMAHVISTFRHLYPQVAADGVYMVEDLHTAYYPDYGGGLRKPGTFIELCKDLIDEMHANYTGGALAPTAFGASPLGMHFYDSIVAFDRGHVPARVALKRPVTDDDSNDAY